MNQKDFNAAEQRRMPGLLVREERTIEAMDIAMPWWIEILRRHRYSIDRMPTDQARAVLLALRRRGIALGAGR